MFGMLAKRVGTLACSGLSGCGLVEPGFYVGVGGGGEAEAVDAAAFAGVGISAQGGKSGGLHGIVTDAVGRGNGQGPVQEIA